MIDTAQAVLLFVVVILAVLLLILGIQVFFILRELRHTVSKANKVLDDTGTITESVSGPITTLSSIVSGVKVGAVLTHLLKKKKRKVLEDEDE
ncbi:MAG: hypothetical protein HYY87_02800 [Candidatus Levybacteria bacterium]|nr:hypothetical protein [Candidatus Levybacteria bacterium]MBI3070210.1 hypothetical protein [Candidatus Levybacteria bacterium]MBI3093023.1 hypothetical protein [Candidatus Levybacteria bacterium]